MDPIQTQIPNQTPTQPQQPIGGNPYNLVGGSAIPVQQVAQAPIGNIPVPQSIQGVQISAPIPVQGVSSSAPKEGILEKIVKGIVRFIAKASGNPDPFTGMPNPTAGQQGIQAGSLFGQIGGAISGIASTAQGMVGGAVTGVQQIGQTAVSGVQQVGQTVIQAVPQVQVVPGVQQVPVQVPVQEIPVQQVPVAQIQPQVQVNVQPIPKTPPQA